MLADPLAIDGADWALIQNDADLSVRVCSVDFPSDKLRIMRSTSKENAPYVTKRTVIRFDRKIPDANGKVCTYSVYQVYALPENGPGSDTAIADELVARINILNTTVLSRILAGEG
jgi:hypothetical protein